MLFDTVLIDRDAVCHVILLIHNCDEDGEASHCNR